MCAYNIIHTERSGASDDHRPVGDSGHVDRAPGPDPEGSLRHQHVHPRGDSRPVARLPRPYRHRHARTGHAPRSKAGALHAGLVTVPVGTQQRLLRLFD